MTVFVGYHCSGDSIRGQDRARGVHTTYCMSHTCVDLLSGGSVCWTNGDMGLQPRMRPYRQRCLMRTTESSVAGGLVVNSVAGVQVRDGWCVDCADWQTVALAKQYCNIDRPCLALQVHETREPGYDAMESEQVIGLVPLSLDNSFICLQDVHLHWAT